MMRVFHILDEISNKNYSIINIIKLYSDLKRIKSKIIIGGQKNFKPKLIPKKNIYQINFRANIFNYKSIVQNFLILNKPDIIHIHGVWRPIYIIFVILAKKFQIPLIIQPHGMFLKGALNSGSNFKILIKRILIFFYKIYFKQTIFIVATNEEKNSINKYFKKNKVFLIRNPIIFQNFISKKIKHEISYFGRFNPHKNILLIVNSFLQSNLDTKWKLNLYCIKDDIYYEKYVRKKIKNLDILKRIKIKKPIFKNNLKLKKMSESFINILMSKSEILSFSVLEALSVGTKSLVSKKLKFPNKISKFLYFSNPNTKDISNKIDEIIRNYKPSLNLRKNIKKSFIKYYNSHNSIIEYQKILKKIDNKI